MRLVENRGLMKLSTNMTSYYFIWSREVYKGKWRELFIHPEHHYIWSLVQVRDAFIAGMSGRYPDANFVGFEVQMG